jgi:hypothetical protein
MPKSQKPDARRFEELLREQMKLQAAPPAPKPRSKPPASRKK